MTPASEALQRLRDGNRRFAAEEDVNLALESSRAHRRRELVAGQKPFAVILGCSDSRVPAELVFDQGLGDLFVIRVAGNIVAPSQIGSVEFAVQEFDTRLVVVLGHSGCGAVSATLRALEQPGDGGSDGLRSIVERIRPAIETLTESSDGDDPEAMMWLGVRANIRASAGHLRHGSPILERLIADEGLRVIGAEYSLDSGLVDFFDGAETDSE